MVPMICRRIRSMRGPYISKLINHGLEIREKLLQRAQDENVTVMDIVKREMADS